MNRARVLVVLNGSISGYSGGDLHTVKVANSLAATACVEPYLPEGSSPEILSMLIGTTGGGLPLSAKRSPNPGRFAYLLTVIGRTLRAAWFVRQRRGRWAVAIASSHFPFDVWPVLMSGARHRAIYWHHHAVARHSRPAWTRALLSAWELTLSRLLAGRLVSVITVSRDTREWLLGRGVRPAQLFMTTNSTSLAAVPDDANDSSVARTLAALSERRFALYFGRISKLKGAADLPAIAHAVDSALPGVPVVICGLDTAEAKAIRLALAPLEARHSVIFMGYVPEPTKKWLFDHAHVLMAPSYEEGWSLTVADGLLAGGWVVTYDLPSVRDNNPDGPLFVPTGDVKTFADAVITCLRRPRPGAETSAGSLSTWEAIARSDIDAILSV